MLYNWPGLLEAWLALTSVKYHGNLYVLTPLNQRLALTSLWATDPWIGLWNAFLTLIIPSLIDQVISFSKLKRPKMVKRKAAKSCFERFLETTTLVPLRLYLNFSFVINFQYCLSLLKSNNNNIKEVLKIDHKEKKMY